jgi:mannose-6-phosphate isomerase-like protein (cupin superfamily)
MIPAARRFCWDDISLDKVTEMVSRKEICADTDGLAQTYLKKGALVPLHSHDAAQWVYVLQGALAVTIGTEVQLLREGDVLRISARTEHQAEAMEDTFVLDLRGK